MKRQKISMKNEMYLMNLRNIVSHMRSREVKDAILDGQEMSVFPHLTALSIAWATSVDNVFHDYMAVKDGEL